MFKNGIEIFKNYSINGYNGKIFPGTYEITLAKGTTL